MNIKDAYIHNGDAILKDIQLSGSKLQKLKAGKNADDTYLTWVDVLDLSPFGASGHNHDDRYLKLSGGTLDGGITFKYGSNRTDQFIQFSSTDSNDPQTVYLGIRRPVSSYGLCYKDNNGNLYDLIHSGNYTTYTVKKDGTGASGTWGINITGNAATATNAGYATNAGNADTVDGCHAGFANGSVVIYAPFPSMTTLKNDGYISSNYKEEGYPDEEFLQGICKWAIATYPNKGDITLMGAIAPNSSGTCIIHLYSSAGSDPTTNLPRYCRGLYQQLGGNLFQFGTVNYEWSYGQISAGYATTAGSASASDVYSWAKQPSKPTYSFSEITPGTATIGNGSTSLIFRSDSAWKSGIYHSVPGNESMVFANINPLTSWMFATADPNANKDWSTLSPSLQIKNGRVTINKLIANGTDASYNLDVNGSANATTLYENGVRVSVNGHTHDDRYYTESEVNNLLANKSNTSHTHSYIVTQGDTRSTATKPNDYNNRITFAGLKTNSTIGSPVTDLYYSYVIGLRGWSDTSGGKAHELAFNDNGIFHRIGATDTWEAWAMMLNTSNYNSYVPSLTGTGASGTWGISITGNATTSTYASNVGSSGTVGTNYVTAANVISMYNWYNSITATDEASNTAIDKWNEIVSFLAGITDTSTLSGILAGYAAVGHDHDGRYVKKAGDTMTGLLTATSGNNHKGIKVGDTYINAIGSDLILQNNGTIRFGGDSWDYNVWAGLKYVHSSKTIYLGLADGSAFTANSAQSGGKLYLPGIDNLYTGNGANLIWHAGNDGSGSGLDADLLDGKHAEDFIYRLRRSNNNVTSHPNNGMIPPAILEFLSAGYPVYTDPEFASGNNSCSVYNNQGNGTVTIERITDNQGSGNSSGYILKITTNGTASPGAGGFIQAISSRANAIFIQVFRAKVPIGYNVINAENAQGDNATITWLTDRAGTGKWEWYARLVYCGNTGSFSVGGHVYLSGTSNTSVTWYLSHITLVDITKGNYNGLRTRYADSADSVVWSNITEKPTTISGYGITDAYTKTQIDTKLNSYLPLSGGELTGKTAIIGQNTGASTISADLDALVIANKQQRVALAGYYYPGIAFNHMWNWDANKTYQNSSQAWIGLKLHSTPGSELSYLVFGTKEGTGAADRPIERMSIAPNGDVNIKKNLSADGSISATTLYENGVRVSVSGHTHSYLPLSGGTMNLGEGLKFHADENYFGTNLDARIISLLDSNGEFCDGGLIIDERATFNGVETITELLRIRHNEFTWKGNTIWHAGNLTKVSQLTNDKGYVTSSGVTSVATGTGLTGGTITSTGTISINSTYQTYISHGESAYNSLDNYYPVLNSTGKWSANGAGKNAYCLIAEIDTNASYINYPITFEIGGRGTITSRVTIRFANQLETDPDCSLFVTDQASCYYLHKAATNTWRLYASSPTDSSWGTWYVYRIFGGNANMVTMKMETVSSLPSEYRTVTYTGNVEYATNAGSVSWNNVTGKPTTINGYGITDALKIDGSNGTADGVSALINKLSVGSSDPTDADYYVCQFAGGGTTTTTYHRRPMSAMWNWIKAKTNTLYPTKTGSGASGTWGINVTGSAKRLESNSSTNIRGLSYCYIGGSTFNTTVDGSWSGYSATTNYNSIVRLQSHDGTAKYYIDLIFDVNNSEIYYRRVTNNSLANIRKIDAYEVPESTASYSLSNAAWTNTITLPTTAGSYILNIVSGNSTLTGVFSIGASDNAKDEISLHLHGNGPRLYARTNGTTLQLSSNDASATSRSVTIKYRRMI